MPRYGTFSLLGERDASEIPDARRRQVKSTVDHELEEYLLNVNEDDYVRFFVGASQLEPVQLNFDGVEISTYDASIPAEHHPGNYSESPGKSYRREIVSYHVPFTGGDSACAWKAAAGVGVTFLYQSEPNGTFLVHLWRHRPGRRDDKSRFRHCLGMCQLASNQSIGNAHLRLIGHDHRHLRDRLQ